MRTLSRFPSVMQSAVDAVISTAEALRYLKTTSGDLPWHVLDRVQDGLRTAKVTTYATFAEATRQPEAAEAYMASMGGPQTLADYQAKAAQIEVAAAAWNAYLAGWVATLPHEELIGVVIVNQGGVETKHVERPAFVPGDIAEPLRESQELADLLIAFESVGA